MITAFNIEIKNFTEIHQLTDSWSDPDFQKILTLCEFEDAAVASSEELQEYAMLSLQDKAPQKAAEVVLTARLSERLRPGQIKDAASDMMRENLWEEYQDMSLHEELFIITAFLHKVFPRTFPEPDAADVTMAISAMNNAAEQALKQLEEPFICRAIADGMSQQSILYRLFDEQLSGKGFEEAKDIIWQYRVQENTGKQCIVEFTTANQWVKELKTAGTYSSTAYNDV